MQTDLLSRVSTQPGVMGGRPCIRGTRVTIGAVLGMLAEGETHNAILEAYPYLEPEDIRAALAFAARRFQEQAFPIAG